MVEISISNAARSDLLSMDVYGIDQFGEEAADTLSAGFERAFAQLAGFRRSAAEYGEDIRRWIHLGYRVCIGSKGIGS